MRWFQVFTQWMVQLTFVISLCSIIPSAPVFAGNLKVRAEAESLAPPGLPSELDEVKITEHLAVRVPVEEFNLVDSKGEKFNLATAFKSGKPVIFTPMYYGCPNLCQWGLKGLVNVLKQIDWTPGDQFEIVTFSINPNETSELAARHKAKNLESYGKQNAAVGWHFLTGDEATVSRLAQSLGFGYKYDPNEKEYGHAAAIMVLTPKGKISRYLYGIEFKPQDFKMALLEASNGKIGNVVDRLILFCFRYDPHTRKYSVYSTRLMEAGCLLTTVVLGGYLFVYWRRQRKGS